MARTIPSLPSDPLLERVAAGERAAAAACVERWGPRIAALASRFGLEGKAAEAAVREIFRTLWAEAGAHRPSHGAEVNFAVQVARRWLLDRRKRGASAARPSGGSFSASPPIRQTDLFGESGRVARALRSLDPEERVMLELAVVQGLSYARIASLAERSPAEVRDAARRSLIRVRELLHAEAREARAEARP